MGQTSTTSTNTTEMPTTTTSTTEMATTSIKLIDGLTPEESAVYNPELASYWDLQGCGNESDNHHREWCWNGAFKCLKVVPVNSTICPSGVASLNFTRQLAKVDGRTFAYFAQYVCQAVKTKGE